MVALMSPRSPPLADRCVGTQHFVASIQLASATPDPSPAPHLYLAQLSDNPQESLTHFGNALAILQAKLAALERAKLGLDGGAGTQEELEDEGEIRRSASRALVGMTELYLTDLWCVPICLVSRRFPLTRSYVERSFEPEAERNCEKYLAQAAELDPSDPEVYQVRCSIRSAFPLCSQLRSPRHSLRYASVSSEKRMQSRRCIRAGKSGGTWKSVRSRPPFPTSPSPYPHPWQTRPYTLPLLLV